MTQERLSIVVEDWAGGVQVDAAARLVRNVSLAGRESKNGYSYTEEALKQAVPMYEGKPVFLDHATDKSRPRERSTRDLAGAVTNPRYEGDRLRGDVKVLDTESGRTFLALAAANSPGVGMSHVVLAERSEDGKAVQKVHDVVSVDAVVSPATNSNFSESEDPMAKPDEKKPDNKPEQKPERTVEQAQAELEALQKKYEDLEKRIAERDQQPEKKPEQKPTTEQKPDAGNDPVVMERKRISALTAVCDLAKVDAATRQQYIDEGLTVEDVSLALRKKMSADNPGPEAGKGDPAESDPDAKFKKEFKDRPAELREQFPDLTEADYVYSRRVDAGLEKLAPQPKKAEG